jgi:hypothetical protein
VMGTMGTDIKADSSGLAHPTTTNFFPPSSTEYNFSLRNERTDGRTEVKLGQGRVRGGQREMGGIMKLTGAQVATYIRGGGGVSHELCSRS